MGTWGVTAPTLAVVLATFNGAAFVGEQLESLARQTCPPDELIVSDDGSSDDTVAIVRCFARSAPFPVLVTEGPRSGLADNFWQAAQLSRADLIAWCDQDDVWAPDKLEQCVRAIEAHGAELVTHSALVTDARLAPSGRRFPDYRHTRVRRPLEGDPWYVPPGFATVFSRSLLEDVPWDRRPRSHQYEAPTSHDHSVALLAFGTARRVELEPALARYRQHGGNAAGAPKLRGIGKVRFAFALPATQFRDLADIAGEYAEYFRTVERPAREAEAYFRQAQARCLRRFALRQPGTLPERTRRLLHSVFHGDFKPRERGGFGLRGFSRDLVELLAASPSSAS